MGHTIPENHPKPQDPKHSLEGVKLGVRSLGKMCATIEK